MSTLTPTSSRPKLRRVLWGSATVVVVVLAAIVFGAWLSFHAKAEGIAVGYLQAASSAYQMGRPIPDLIFETMGSTGSRSCLRRAPTRPRVGSRSTSKTASSIRPSSRKTATSGRPAVANHKLGMRTGYDVDAGCGVVCGVGVASGL